MKVLVITAGMVPVRAISNSYQEAFMEGMVTLGHQVACLCMAEVSIRPGLSWNCNRQGPFVRYSIFNAGIYPAFYSQGGIGSRTPLRDVYAGPTLRKIFLKIIRAEKPEVVNIQSLFGLPFDLIESIQGEGIPVVFTAHDYFAVCPTAHLFLPEEQPCRLRDSELVCLKCCKHSSSYRAFWLSSQLDRLAGELGSHTSVRKCIWRIRNAVKRIDTALPRSQNHDVFGNRRKHAVEFLRRLDVLHCISQHQAKVFQTICGPLQNIRILPLVPPTIEHLKPVPKTYNENQKVSFVALNVNGTYKGSKLLEHTFRLLANSTSHYELHIYGNSTPGPEIPSVFYHGRYCASELDRIAENADYCIIPSVWDETLGFTGLEMLARGVPLIASARAGVSDFIQEGQNGWIFDPASPDQLFETVKQVLHQNTTIPRGHSTSARAFLKTFRQHIEQMADLLASSKRYIEKPELVAVQ